MRTMGGKFRTATAAVALASLAFLAACGGDDTDWGTPPGLVMSIFYPSTPADVEALHSAGALREAVERHFSTITWDGVDCSWLPLSPAQNLEFRGIRVSEETNLLRQATACVVSPPGNPPLATVVVSTTQSCTSSFYWGQLMADHPGVGYFVTQERETVRDDGSVYVYAWVGWQTSDACLAVKLVNDPDVRVEVTQSAAMLYMVSLEYALSELL